MLKISNFVVNGAFVLLLEVSRVIWTTCAPFKMLALTRSLAVL